MCFYSMFDPEQHADTHVKECTTVCSFSMVGTIPDAFSNVSSGPPSHESKSARLLSVQDTDTAGAAPWLERPSINALLLRRHAHAN